MISRSLVLVIAALLAGSGCSILAPGELDFDISADQATATPDDPVLLTVTVRNVGKSRVSWGPGSSTCQLRLSVRVDGEDRSAPDHRECLTDLVTHVLEPGEERTETLRWGGWSQVPGPSEGLELLPPGSYELRAVAPGAARSEAVVVDVRAAETYR